MSVELIEVGTGHVFEVTVTPDTPGRCKRAMRVEQVAGPPLTDEQWRRIRVLVVREMINHRFQVVRVREVRDG